jgi:hypothetical protein
MLNKDLLAHLDVLAAKVTDPHDAEVLREAATAIRTFQQGLAGWQLDGTIARSEVLSLADKLFVYQHSRRGALL